MFKNQEIVLLSSIQVEPQVLPKRLWSVMITTPISVIMCPKLPELGDPRWKEKEGCSVCYLWAMWLHNLLILWLGSELELISFLLILLPSRATLSSFCRPPDRISALIKDHFHHCSQSLGENGGKNHGNWSSDHRPQKKNSWLGQEQSCWRDIRITKWRSSSKRMGSGKKIGLQQDKIKSGTWQMWNLYLFSSTYQRINKTIFCEFEHISSKRIWHEWTIGSPNFDKTFKFKKFHFDIIPERRRSLSWWYLYFNSQSRRRWKWIDLPPRSKQLHGLLQRLKKYKIDNRQQRIRSFRRCRVPQ